MANVLAHRGPDGEGSFAAEPGVALGHRRLAIIDLSDAGIQPFASDDGALQLLHNGEVYNYRELRAELEGRGHRFRTATDTEVVLRAYEEWGDRCVERFNGMWAFALWDGRRAAALLLARPLRREAVLLPLRRRPLRVRERAEGVPRRPVDPRCEPNLDAVRDYLEQGALDHTDETFFAGIRKLAARALARLRPRRACGSSRYWTLERARRAERPGRRGARAVPRLGPAAPAQRRPDRHLPLGRRSTRPRSRARSTTCCETEVENARPVGDRQRTFTAYFEDAGFDERPFAPRRRRADERGPALGLVQRRGPRRVRSRRSSSAQDEPFGSTSIVAQWFVMRAARERRAQGDARRPGRRRGPRRLSDVLRVPLRRPARARPPPDARPRARRVPPAARRVGAGARERRCSARSPPSA